MKIKVTKELKLYIKRYTKAEKDIRIGIKKLDISKRNVGFADMDYISARITRLVVEQYNSNK